MNESQMRQRAREEIRQWPEMDVLGINDWWIEQFNQYKASLIRQIEEQRSSVEQLKEKMGIAYEDLSVQVAYKEGYNASLEDIKKKII